MVSYASVYSVTTNKALTGTYVENTIQYPVFPGSQVGPDVGKTEGVRRSYCVPHSHLE